MRGSRGPQPGGDAAAPCWENTHDDPRHGGRQVQSVSQLSLCAFFVLLFLLWDWGCLISPRFLNPRLKIESIIRRGQGLKDPDAPADPASVQFWVTDKMKLENTTTLTQSHHLQLRGNAGAGFLGNLTSGISVGRERSADLAALGGAEQLMEMSKEMQSQGQLFLRISKRFLAS